MERKYHNKQLRNGSYRVNTTLYTTALCFGNRYTGSVRHFESTRAVGRHSRIADVRPSVRLSVSLLSMRLQGHDRVTDTPDRPPATASPTRRQVSGLNLLAVLVVAHELNLTTQGTVRPDRPDRPGRAVGRPIDERKVYRTGV